MKGEVKEELAEDDSGAKTSPPREGGDGMRYWFSSIPCPSCNAWLYFYRVE